MNDVYKVFYMEPCEHCGSRSHTDGWHLQEIRRLLDKAVALREMFAHAGLQESQAVNNALLIPEYGRIDRT